MSIVSTQEQWREKHRQQRAAIDAKTQQAHADSLLDRLMALPCVQSAQHIAAYIAIRGEISLTPAMQQLSDAGKQFYLPVLRENSSMHFAPWAPGEPLLKKGFGLLEPDVPESSWRPAERLDLVLAPLVVFDSDCNRIGQGGGYYDRTFAFRKSHAIKAPVLLGVAHESQREAKLAVQPWDVPLDMIATDSTLYIRQ